MRRVLAAFCCAASLLVWASVLLGAASNEEGESVEEWVRTLTNLRESNIALPMTENNLAVVFNLRDLPVLLKLTTRANEYAFNLFMNVDGRGMLIPSGFSCYVEDFMTFESSRRTHIFVKIRAVEINMPVWTTIEILENALWGSPNP